MTDANRRPPSSVGAAAVSRERTPVAASLPALLLLTDSAIDNDEVPSWASTVRVASPVPRSVAGAITEVLDDVGVAAVLCWAKRLGPPPPAAVLSALLGDAGVDVAHGGLQLGLGGLPRRMYQVRPTWMHSLDPSPETRGTSWRVSLEAALIRRPVLRQAGGVDPSFDSLAGAGVEAGHRWLRSGALVEAHPQLLAHLHDTPRHTSAAEPAEPVGSANSAASAVSEWPSPLSDADEIRFLLRRTGRLWAGFALACKPPARGAWRVLPGLLSETGVASEIVTEHLAHVNHVDHAAASSHTGGAVTAGPDGGVDLAAVSVLIPTIDRAPWLRVVLDQLRAQSVAPHQVIVIDQSGSQHWDPDIAGDFADLPIAYCRQTVEGQSTARNQGLSLVTGDVVLFLDDDDEIEPDLIERHLATLNRFHADVCSGVANEPSSGALPAEFTYLRSSDVLGTNNASVRRSMLEKVGGFDLAFDHGPRADLDLGIRLHVAGARMVLDPSIRVLHHRAPRGGLRTFEARRVTRGSSRQAIFETVPSAATELYLWHHHFGPVRRRQAERIRLLSSLSGSGPLSRQLARFVVQAAKVLTGWEATARRSAREGAAALLAIHPTIDRPLTPGPTDPTGAP